MVLLLSGTDLSSSFSPTAAGVVVLWKKTFLLSLPHAVVLASYLSSLLTSVDSYELLQVEWMFFKVPELTSQSPSAWSHQYFCVSVKSEPCSSKGGHVVMGN